ncbi:MAG TPA: GWxTD domain-containing protein [Candidatus Krumholzibacteria bacterium]|nr:GWxTD domain-containing protein [Candidatus Krumholzibacteria bacterium]
MNSRSRLLPLLAVLALAAPGVLADSPALAQGFGLFANAFLDSSRVPTTRVTVEVPFRSLVFLKKEGYFDSRYEAYLSIVRSGEEPRRPTTYVLHGVATVKTYEETRRRDQKSRTWREFNLPPGDYTIDATLTVANTQISMRRSVTLRVPDFLASGIAFGTPLVLAVPPGYAAGMRAWAEAGPLLGDAVTPPDASIAGLERQPAVRFALFVEGTLSEPEPCDVFYEVTDSGDRQILYGRRRLMLAGTDDEYVLAFNVDDWSPGVYHVNLRARTYHPDRDATASVDVRVDVTRAMLGANFDDTIEILGLIASSDELKPLREAPEAQRAAAWAKFWAARDPDPSTDVNEALSQYIARLQYVTEEFSQFGPGWRSDRGRVYIRFGPPEQIDTAMDQRSTGEYEIWRYYTLGRSFIFYDMFGVGDFKLVEGDL